MSGLELFSIGAWTLFDHVMRVEALPREGDTVPLDMPPAAAAAVHFGDCSANIAAAAARLGTRTGLGMVVGEDFETSGYRRHLAGLGVDLGGVDVRAGAMSGHSYNIFDGAGRGFCISHLAVAADQDDWAPPLEAIDGAAALVVSEMFGAYTLAALEHAWGEDKLTAINGMVATAGPLAERFLAATDMLFLSRSEAADLVAHFGLPGNEALLRLGPEAVVVTEGTAGSTWHLADGTFRVPSVAATRFVDSTGAGDSFVAGALTGILRGLSHRDAGRLAATVASFVVEDWGCQTNLPTWAAAAARYKDAFNEDLPA